MSEHCVFLFEATSHALRAEKLLRREGVPGRLIPVPRHLSSDCGVCLRVERRTRSATEDALARGKVRVAGIHDV